MGLYTIIDNNVAYRCVHTHGQIVIKQCDYI